MAIVRLSPSAKSDLKDITGYTLRVWGPAQADRYLSGIELYLQNLALSPEQGRPCDTVLPGLRRSEHEKHIIFYRRIDGGIGVSRILHQSMDIQRHSFDYEL
jgi:toxin ParE1/3/4